MLRADQIVGKDIADADVCGAGRGRRVWIGLACFGTFGVLLVSLVPQGTAVVLQGGFGDKVPHAAAYCLLTWFWLKACWGGGGRGRMLVVILVPIAIGTAVELIQPLAGRVCDLMDWVANVAGVSVVVIVWMIRMWRRRVVAE